MAVYPQYYDSTNSVLQSAGLSLTIPTGTLHGPTTFNLWNDKGAANADAETLRNVRIEMRVFDGTAWVLAGYPTIDEAWFHLAITGIINTGDSTMAPRSTGATPLGAGLPKVFGDIPKNCAVTFTIEIAPPGGGTAVVADQVMLVVYWDEAAVPMALKQSLALGAGVIPDFREPGARRLRRGRTITAAGTATLTVEKGAFAFDAVPYNRIAEPVTLNQTAGDGALTTGQSYKAVLSQPQNGAVVVTKGNRSATPAVPSWPSSTNIYLATVTVTYQAGAVSVITSGNIDTTLVTYGEFAVRAGSGTNVVIGGGYAVSSTDRYLFHGSNSTLGVTNNTTNYVWLRGDGTFSATTTSTAPAIGAQLLAMAVASAGVVTSVTDARSWADRGFEIVLRYPGAIPSSMAEASLWEILPRDAYLESVDFEIGDLGTGGTSGSFKADVLTRGAGVATSTAGTTIYTSSATSDQRPAIAHNASSLRSVGNVDHEVNYHAAGTRVSFGIPVVPAGTFSVDASDAYIMLRYLRK